MDMGYETAKLADAVHSYKKEIKEYEKQSPTGKYLPIMEKHLAKLKDDYSNARQFEVFGYNDRMHKEFNRKNRKLQRDYEKTFSCKIKKFLGLNTILPIDYRH